MARNNTKLVKTFSESYNNYDLSSAIMFLRRSESERQKDLEEILEIKQKEKRNKYQRNKYKEDVNFKLSRILRTRMNIQLRKTIKTCNTNISVIRHLGCTIPELKCYLEKKFYPHHKTSEAMTWDNWSLKGWHIDHIYPLSKFDLTNPEQIKIACHYTNLQPLWAEQNLSKGNKIL